MNPIIENLLAVFRRPADTVPEEEPRISVSHALTAVAGFYEKIRNAVDYKEEHLIRKNAVLRILRRLVVTHKTGTDIAKKLLEELISGGYFADNTLPESRIEEVSAILEKYLVLRNQISRTRQYNRKVGKLQEWLLELAANEIDELLVPAYRTKALVDAMYKVASQNITFSHDIDPEEKRVQLYIACMKALVRPDLHSIEFILMKHYHAEWFSEPETVMEDMVKNIDVIYEHVVRKARDPLNIRMRRQLHSYAVVFDVLRDILNEDPDPPTVMRTEISDAAIFLATLMIFMT